MTDHKLLPRVPTEEMFLSLKGIARSDLIGDQISRDRLTEIWQAMLDAAPDETDASTLWRNQAEGHKTEVERLRHRCMELEGALREAIEWGGYDDHDVPAVWLDRATAALEAP
jgi:hypothetical protein